MSTPNTPLVSVIMPAYNAEGCIEKAIDSVLRQTLDDLELIIVDDKSMDATRQVIAAKAREDKRIHYHFNESNVGPGAARNIAIGEARGEWIAVLDADDWYEPERLQRLVNTANLMDLPIAADNQYFVMAAGGARQELLLEREERCQLRFITADDLLLGDRLHRKAKNLGLLKPLFRRSFLTEHNIRYDQDRAINFGEDFYFLLRCLRHTPHLVFVYEPLYNYCVYFPLTQTKRQTLDSLLAFRALHARHSALFDPHQAPKTALLMARRGEEIDSYIRFKQFADPLKHGQPGKFFKQAFRDPGGIPLLFRNMASDPGGILLLVRYLGRHTSQRLLTEIRRLFQRTKLPDKNIP